MGMFASLRQIFYPPEFRIAPMTAPDLTTYLRVIANLLDKNDIAKTTSDESLKFIIDLSVSFWRLRNMMLEPGTELPHKDMRHAYDALIAPWNALIQAGISIRDHTDEPYDSSMALNVINVRETAGLMRPIILETVRPSIYLQGRPLLFGDVIVGIPATGRFGTVE